jgi:hypothetical protein
LLLALLSHLALRVVGVVGREEEFELPFLDLEEETWIDKVEIETIREIEQGKKRKNKLEELLRRRRAPQYGSEGRIVIG